MYVEVDDPEPMRCPNHRSRYLVSRGIVRRRCKRSDQPPHVCEFDPFPEDSHGTTSWVKEKVEK